MNLYERPLTQKVNGDEPIANTVVGVDANWRSESQLITDLVDKLPFYATKELSTVTASAEAAYPIPGQQGHRADRNELHRRLRGQRERDRPAHPEPLEPGGHAAGAARPVPEGASGERPENGLPTRQAGVVRDRPVVLPQQQPDAVQHHRRHAERQPHARGAGTGSVPQPAAAHRHAGEHPGAGPGLLPFGAGPTTTPRPWTATVPCPFPRTTGPGSPAGSTPPISRRATSRRSSSG